VFEIVRLTSEAPSRRLVRSAAQNDQGDASPTTYRDRQQAAIIGRRLAMSTGLFSTSAG
jgi:hypothetical protein